ncbi:MAG: UDP-N-acetylmuramoyl-L-alanine--D-glutamate ligase, partial [Chloroflexota bacterium]
LDPGPMIEAIVEVRPTVHLIDGTATARIAAELASQGIAWTGPHQSMASALAAARTDAVSGDVVLLSPGCASFGVFTDEFDRGAQFRALLQQSGTGR